MDVPFNNSRRMEREYILNQLNWIDSKLILNQAKISLFEIKLKLDILFKKNKN